MTHQVKIFNGTIKKFNLEQVQKIKFLNKKTRKKIKSSVNLVDEDSLKKFHLHIILLFLILKQKTEFKKRHSHSHNFEI